MFKKPTQGSIIENTVTVTSAVGGGMLSNGLISLTPEKMVKHKKIIRAGLAAVAILGASAVKGNNNQAKALKGAFAGMGITQAIALVKEVASESASISKKANSAETVDKFVAGVFGLGCPCDAGINYTSMPQVHVPALNIPQLRSAFQPAMQSRKQTLTASFD